MYKDASYKEKLEALAHWLPKIVDSTKKEIKNEHLKKDPQFIKKYLSSKHVNILNSEEIAAAYLLFISENSERAEPTAEFIISNWLTKNSELYNVFEDYLKSISEDFVSLQELSADQSDKLLELAYNYSDPEKVYIFSVCNSVVFPAAKFAEMESKAKTFNAAQEQAKLEAAEIKDLEELKKRHELEINRLTDKFEKKFFGLQKKYAIDQTALKKQIAALQRQLQNS